MFTSRQQKFVLIELMVVVSVVGALAAVALPAYSTYLVKARISEAIAATGPCKNLLTERLVLGASEQQHSDECLGDPDRPVSKYVKRVMVTAEEGVKVQVHGIGQSDVDDKWFNLVPITSEAQGAARSIHSWKCETDASPLTGVPPRFLPGSCR